MKFTRFAEKHRRVPVKAVSLGLAAAFAFTVLPVQALADAIAGIGTDYTQFVDPFVATQVDNGQQFPGAVVPYGIVKLSADTYPHVADDHSGYDYAATKISGFSHTRIEGVGGQGAGGDVLVTPTYVNYTAEPTMASRAQSFSHSDETATPGYYAVSLTPNTGTDTGTADTTMGKIKAEMTTTTRTGFHRYTFPQAGKVSLVTDLNYTYHGTDIRNAVMQVGKTDDGRTTISGRFSAHNVSGHGTYTMYFYMETDTPTTAVQTWNGGTLGSGDQQGNDIGAILQFDVKQNQAVQVKVAISPISSDQAKLDMSREDAGWDFDAVRDSAKTQWNDILGKVDITSSTTSDPDGSLKKLFYTSLYRMFTMPVNATSTSGTYRGTDGKIYEAKGYTHYDCWTLWDDFHKYPMIGLIAPDVYKDIIHSVADMLTTGISDWGNDTQPVLTVRNEHAVALLADGVAKGYTDIDDLESAYEAAKAKADSAVSGTTETQGYFTGRVDQTVEHAYDDWALSVIAEKLGKTDDAEKYLKRSFNYKNLYKADAVTKNGTTMGLLWPKDSSGNWMSADPEQYGNNGLYQGTLWQYTWWDTNDVGGLRELMGGKANMLKELETLFGAKGASADGHLMLHSNTNEIDLQTPYLFNAAGKPSETQYWVRQIYTGETWNRYSGTGEYNPPQYTKVYKLSPDGLMQTMDDDGGTMATMFVSAAMGLYAMTPGDPTFQIGTPFFEKMTLDLGGGKTFTIHANNVSPQNYYIQSATLDGSALNRSWLDYSEISRGGDVTFEMGANPSTWAEDGVTAPSSSDTVSTALNSSDPISYSTSVFAESDKNDGSIGNTIDVKVSGTTANGAAGADLIASGGVTVSNVPAGLTATAVKVDDTTVRIGLAGKAVAHQKDDSIENLHIALNDSLFAGTVSSANKSRDVRVLFNDAALSFDQLKITSSEGAVDGTVHATLSGGATFSGTAGAVTADGLPDGVSMTVTKDSDTQLSLHFVGQMTDITSDYMVSHPIVTFADDAFAGGVKASQVQNATLGGLSSLELVNTMTPVSIAVTAPTKTVYLPGEPLNTAGGAVHVNYSVESLSKTIPLDADGVTVSSMPAQLGDHQPVTVTYDGKSAAFNVDIQALKADPNGIVLHYDFNKSSGNTVEDLSGNGFDGTLVNGASVQEGSLTLDSSQKQYLNVPTSVLSGLTGDFTMSAWVNVAAAQNNQQLFFAGTSDQNFLIWVTNNVIRSGLNINGQGEDRTAASSGTTAGQWAYVTMVQQGSTVTLYLNGKAIASAAVRGTVAQVVQEGLFAHLGGVSFWGDPGFNGQISDFAIYNKALTADEIVAEADRTDNTLAEMAAYAQALLDKGGYSAASTKALQQSLDNANAVLRYPSPTAAQKSTAKQALNTAVLALSTVGDAYAKIEAESFTAWSGNGLVSEPGTDSSGNALQDVGGTHDGSWLEYAGKDFGTAGANQITVRYSTNGSSTGGNCRIDIYLDSMTGTPAASVPLPVTGDSWSDYQTVAAALPTAITGTHDVYMVLHTASANVANLDWYQFSEAKNDDYGKLEAENYSAWSAGNLKTETSTDSDGASLVDLGATYDGAWLEYAGRDFSGNGAEQFTVRYSNNSGRCGSNSRIEIYLDSRSGTPIQTVSLPATGSAWSSYSTTTVALDTPISGVHDVYFVLRSDTTSDHPYVANFDWFQFIEAPNTAYEKREAESYTSWSAGTLKTETSTDSGGTSLVDLGATSDGSWVAYDKQSFGSTGASQFTVRYVNNSSRCGANSSMDIYLDSMTGTPVQSVPLPVTGSAWNAYATTTVNLKTPITGTHTVYYVLHTTPDGSHPYVANLDWMQFTEATGSSYGKWELEGKDDWSGGALKTETSTDSNGQTLTDLGGTYDGAWVKFSARSFTGNGADKFSVRYVNNSGRCGTDSRIDIYLDSMTGTPVDTVNLPVTGSNWNAYQQLDATLSNGITGTHDVYFVLHTTTDSGHPYVANLDWVSFAEAADKSALQQAYDANAALLSQGAAYLPEDFSRFQAAMTQAQAVLEQADVTSDDINAAVQAISDAVARLHARPDKAALTQQTADAKKLDTSIDTEESAAALAAAVQYADTVLSDDNATQADVDFAAAQMQAATTGLTEKPIANKKALSGMLSQAKAIQAQGYTEDSFKALTDAIAAAQATADEKYAPQATVDAQVLALKTTISGLKEVQTAERSLQDTASGIAVLGDSNTLPQDAAVQVTAITETDAAFTTVKNALAFDSSRVQAFTVAVTSGGKPLTLRPGVLVQISVPVPAGWDSTRLAAYLIEADGSRTLSQGRVENGAYVFNARQFGQFALAQKKTADELAQDAAAQQQPQSTQAAGRATAAFLQESTLEVVSTGRRKETDGGQTV